MTASSEMLKNEALAKSIITAAESSSPGLTEAQKDLLANNKAVCERVASKVTGKTKALIQYPMVQEAIIADMFESGASTKNQSLLTDIPELIAPLIEKFLTEPSLINLIDPSIRTVLTQKMTPTDLERRPINHFSAIVGGMPSFRKELIDLMIKKGNQDLSQNEISLLKSNEKLVNDIITIILKENDFSKVAKLIENPSIKTKLVDTLVKSSGLSTNEEKLLSSNETLASAAAKAAKENSPLEKNPDVIKALKREKTRTDAILTSVINNQNEVDFLTQKIKIRPKYKRETVLERFFHLQTQIQRLDKPKENFSEMIELIGIKPGNSDYDFILAGFNDRPDDKKAIYSKELFNFFESKILAKGKTKINTKKNLFFERNIPNFNVKNPLPALKKKVGNLEIKDTLLTAARSFKSNIAQKLPNVKIEPVVFLKKIKTTIQGAIENIHLSPNILKKGIENSILSDTIKDLVKKSTSNINIGKWKVQNLKGMVDKFELLDENKLTRFTMEKINKTSDQVKIDFAPIRSLTLETALIAMDAITVPPIEINSGNINDIQVLVQAAKELGKTKDLCLSDETKKRFPTEFPDVPSATELAERVFNNQKNER